MTFESQPEYTRTTVESIAAWRTALSWLAESVPAGTDGNVRWAHHLAMEGMVASGITPGEGSDPREGHGWGPAVGAKTTSVSVKK